MKKLFLSILCVVSVLSCTKENVSSIVLNDPRIQNGNLTLEAGEVSYLAHTVTPAESAQYVIWSSSNDAVATAVAGYIYANSVGSAVIKASSPDGKKSASVNVTVQRRNITSWKFSSSKLEIAPGFSNYAEVQILAGEGMNEENAKYYTAASLIMSIEGSEYFTYSLSGNTITVKCSADAPSDGSCTAKLVTKNAAGDVTKELPLVAIFRDVESVSLNKTSVDELIIGSSLDLTATISPSNATAKDLEWSCDNGNVTIKPDGTTCTVTGAKAGTAKVTAKAVSNGKSATCTIKVVTPYVRSMSVKMDRTVMCVDAKTAVTKTIEVTIDPPEFQYTVENLTPDIIEVSGNEIKNPKKAGVAKIKVVAADQSVTKEFLVVDKDYTLRVGHIINYGHASSLAEKGGFYTLTGGVSPCIPGTYANVIAAVNDCVINLDSWQAIADAYGDGAADFIKFTATGSFTYKTFAENGKWYYYQSPTTLGAKGTVTVSTGDGKSAKADLTTAIASASFMVNSSYSYDPDVAKTVPAGGEYSVKRPSSGYQYLHAILNPTTNYDYLMSVPDPCSDLLQLVCDNSNLESRTSGSSKFFVVRSTTPVGTYTLYVKGFPSVKFTISVGN